MKKIVYHVEGHTEVYNPASGKIEEKKVIVGVEAEYTEENLEIAKREAYNGEYTIKEE